MKMSSLKPASALLAAVILLPGCKLEIQVPQGGRVVSEDGSFTCDANETCMIDVVDFFFDQTFIAEPAPGYYFSDWLEIEGSSYLCGGVDGPCRLSTTSLEGNADALAFLESDETFRLKPKFVFTLNCPEDDNTVVSPRSSKPRH